MFKNLIFYRITGVKSLQFADLVTAVEASPFVGCGATQPISCGWVSPRNIEHAALAESVGGQWLIRQMVEQRMLPASVVARRVDEMAKAVEDSTGHKPGKREKRDLKEEATLELLPRAFPKQSTTMAWIDPDREILAIDAGSEAKAQMLIAALIHDVNGLMVSPVLTAQSPAGCMAAWLIEGSAPNNFSIDREGELKGSGEDRSTVRYQHFGMDADDVRQHIKSGKLPTKLALTYNARVSLVVTDKMQIKKIEILDVAMEGAQQGEDAFDADAAIATGELAPLIQAVVEAFGGEASPAAAGEDKSKTPNSEGV